MARQRPKERNLGNKIVLAIGAGVWWFIVSDPSIVAWVFVIFILCCLTAAYCYFAIRLPVQDSTTKHTRPAEISVDDKTMANLLNSIK